LKTDRHGQACLLSDADYSKIRKQIKSKKYKLLFDLAWYTGERWGALVQLRVEDCYNPSGSPRDYINFRARTRDRYAGWKASNPPSVCTRSTEGVPL
jgi:integrase/recombinase XerD